MSGKKLRTGTARPKTRSGTARPQKRELAWHGLKNADWHGTPRHDLAKIVARHAARKLKKAKIACV